MEKIYCIDTIPSAAPGFGSPPWLTSMLRLVGRWIERSRQRRWLANLNDDALEDIGLNRTDVRMEIKKPFWHA